MWLLDNKCHRFHSTIGHWLCFRKYYCFLSVLHTSLSRDQALSGMPWAIDRAVETFQDRVFLYSPGSPGTQSVDQAGPKLRNPSASTSQVLGLQVCATTAQLTFEILKAHKTLMCRWLSITHLAS